HEAAGEDHFLGPTDPDGARQPLAAATAGNLSEIQMPVRKTRALARNTQIASQKDLEPARDTIAAHHREINQRRALDRVHEPAEVEKVAAVVVRTPDQVDIGSEIPAGAEMLSRAGKHNDLDL